MKRRYLIVCVLIGVAVMAGPVAADATVEWRNTGTGDATGAAANGSIVVTASDGAGVLAIDRTDGSTIWTNATSGGYHIDINGQRLVYSEFGTSQVIVLDANDGSEIYSYRQSSGTTSGVAINDTYVASGATGNVTLRERSDGSEVWTNNLHGSTDVDRVAIGDGQVYSFNHSVVVAADAASGTKQWSHAVSTASTPSGLAVDATRGIVYVSDGATLVALDASDGSTLWSHTEHTNTIGDIAVDGDLVVSTDDDGNVVAYDQGERYARASVSDGSLGESVAVDDTQFYGGYNTGKLTAWSGHDDAELLIRNETAPSNFVTKSTDVTFQTFDGSAITTTSTSSGTVDIDIEGSGPILATVDPDGYTQRRAIIEDPTRDATVYVLNESRDTTSVEFELDDETGRYSPSESRLYVERPLTRNGETKYRVVTSDRFEADNTVPMTLETGTQYRLRVVNENGDERVLGSYTPQQDGLEILPIGTVTLAGDTDSEDVVAQASLRNAPADAAHDAEARIFLFDPADRTKNFSVVIENETGVVRPETTEDGPYGRYVETVPVNETDYPNGTLYVNFTINRTQSDGSIDTLYIRRPIGDLPDLATDWELDERVLELMGWVSLIALMGLLVISAPTLAALIGVLYAGLLTLLGILPIPGLAIGVAGSAAILYQLGGPEE